MVYEILGAIIGTLVCVSAGAFVVYNAYARPSSSSAITSSRMIAGVILALTPLLIGAPEAADRLFLAMIWASVGAATVGIAYWAGELGAKKAQNSDPMNDEDQAIMDRAYNNEMVQRQLMRKPPIMPIYPLYNREFLDPFNRKGELNTSHRELHEFPAEKSFGFRRENFDQINRKD